MKKTNPTLMYNKQNKKIGVVLTKEVFDSLVDELEDYYDYELIKERIEKKGKTYLMSEVIAEVLARK